MDIERVYTISQLADAAGVSSRAVRYYTAEGLLPPPDARGKFALYGNRHLDRLLYIQKLAAGGLSLKHIRATLAEMADEQVKRELNDMPGATGGTSPASGAGKVAEDAARYIARVLADLKESAALPEAGSPHPGRSPGESGVRYSLSPLPAHGTEPESSPAINPAGAQPFFPIMLHVPDEAAGAEAASAAPHSEALSERQAPAPGTRWERIPLAPGVELHVRQPASRLASRLAAAVKELASRFRPEDSGKEDER